MQEHFGRGPKARAQVLRVMSALFVRSERIRRGCQGVRRRPVRFYPAGNTDRKCITLDELKPYPYLIFEQGDRNSFYFFEELLSMLDMPKTIMLPKEIDTPEQPENPISTYSAAMIQVCRWSTGTICGRSICTQKPLNGIRLAAVFYRFLLHVSGANRRSMGNSSRRPASISKVSTILLSGCSAPKLAAGPT